MSVAQDGTVDAIGVDVETGNLVLTISDHLGWEAEAEHLGMLRAKLNTYLGFIESGELLQAYPDASGRRVVIDIVARVAPSPQGADFLENAKRTIHAAGVEVRFRIRRDAN